MNQSQEDFSAEAEQLKLQEEVVRKIRSNQQLERDLNLMDIKIGLLVKNRITLQVRAPSHPCSSPAAPEREPCPYFNLTLSFSDVYMLPPGSGSCAYGPLPLVSHWMCVVQDTLQGECEWLALLSPSTEAGGDQLTSKSVSPLARWNKELISSMQNAETDVE